MKMNHLEAKQMSEARKRIALLAGLTAALVSGCDGGITGTGGPITEMESTIGAIDSGPSSSDAAPSGEVAVASLSSDSEFVNNANATLRSDSIARIVHTVNELPSIYAVLNQDFTAPLIPQPGIDFGDGFQFYLSLPADTHELDIFSLETEPTEPRTQLAGINPLILSEGSASTLVLRGLTTSVEEDDPYVIEMLAVPNVLSTNQGSTINIRVLHAAPLFDAEQGELDVYLRTTDTINPTTGLPTFEDFNYVTGTSGYFETVAGSYSITATDANGQTQVIPTTEPITPSGGSSTTIIIIDDPDGVAGVDVEFLIVNDGDRTGLPDL